MYLSKYRGKYWPGLLCVIQSSLFSDITPIYNHHNIYLYKYTSYVYIYISTYPHNTHIYIHSIVPRIEIWLLPDQIRCGCNRPIMKDYNNSVQNLPPKDLGFSPEPSSRNRNAHRKIFSKSYQIYLNQIIFTIFRLI